MVFYLLMYRYFFGEKIHKKGEEKMYSELNDIPGFKNWKMIKRVEEGWSSDLKFYIEDLDGNKLLLRISEAAVYDNKREEFQFIKKYKEDSFVEMYKVIIYREDVTLWNT